MLYRDIYPGLIRLHILFHATEGPIFGLGILEELRRHGYQCSPGTLYPILHRLEERGYLVSKQELVEGRIRRTYRSTRLGRKALESARIKVRELYGELFEEGQ